MDQIKPTHGNQIAVSAYLDLETFSRLEKVRGRIPRSAFVSDILSELLEEVPISQEA